MSLNGMILLERNVILQRVINCPASPLSAVLIQHQAFLVCVDILLFDCCWQRTATGIQPITLADVFSEGQPPLYYNG